MINTEVINILSKRFFLIVLLFYLNAETRAFEEHNILSKEHISKTPYENGWE